MSKWKSLLLLLLCMTLLFPSLALPCRAEQDRRVGIPSVSAESALLMEAESGEVIFARSADFPMPMASTTKIMTALAALSLASPDTVIRVDARAVGVEGSSVYLIENEELTLEQLLYALLLQSANDAAAAIAIGLCGSIEAFADHMNRIGVELGLRQTHFENPHGLDSENHFTTAYELALIARAALQVPLLKTICSTKKATIPHPAADQSRILVNHNKLLRTYDGCIGVKTGFTKRSGRCLVSAAERDGVVLIAVTLNAPNDWQDHTAMLDYGFSQYCSLMLCEAEAILLSCPVVGGEESCVTVRNTDALRVTLPIGHGKVTKTVELPPFEYAPIAEGTVLGRVVFRCDTDGDGTQEVVGIADLVAVDAVAKVPRRGFWAWLKGLLGL